MFKMSKKEDIFEDHAIENHPLSLVLFSKTIKEEIEDNFASPDFYVQYAVWTLPLKIMFMQVDESKWVKECGSNFERF